MTDPDGPASDGDPDLASLYDDAPCGYLSTGADGRIVRVNRTFLRWTGHDRAALLAGKRFADLLTVPGRIYHSTHLAPLLQLQGAVTEMAFDIKCPGGATLPVLVNATAVPGPDGRPGLTRLAVFNATQGRRREQELLLARKNAERLSAVVACTGDAILSVTADGLVDGWNAGAERLFGTPAAAVLGRPLAEAVPVAHPSQLAEVVDHVHRGAVMTEAVDFPLAGGPGGPAGRWVSMAVSAVRDGLDRVTGVSAIARDVTARHEAERLRADEAAARAASIAAQAASMAAQAASRAKSDFLANMSHEIRTPLNGVVGMLQLLAGTPLDAGQRRYASVAVASAKSLLTLINDILDFSKIEAGKLELEHLPFDLAELAEQAVAILSVRAGEKGLAVSCAVDPAVAHRRVGPGDRVRQVLVNLLGNAVKFTAAGSVTLRVTMGDPAGDPAGHAADLIRFAVTDTGVGIPPDRLDRLFKSFSQVDASTTRKYGGTGLGLAISRQLAELMGGAVGVESTVGVGSTFWFTARLPADAQPAAAAEPTAVPSTPPAAAAAVPAGRRVLVAEDNEVNQMVVGEMLRRLGYAADLVGDGRAAVEAFVRGGYDLVLMDCQMPEMDGFAATAAIRAEGGPRVPIVALTANALAGDRERCLAAGMDDYLTKPIDAGALAEKLARWLAAGAAAAA